MKKILTVLGLAFMLTGTQANAMGLFYTDATYPVTATGSKVRLINLEKEYCKHKQHLILG